MYMDSSVYSVYGWSLWFLAVPTFFTTCSVYAISYIFWLRYHDMGYIWIIVSLPMLRCLCSSPLPSLYTIYLIICGFTEHYHTAAFSTNIRTTYAILHS
jgi:hypothetical protein